MRIVLLLLAMTSLASADVRLRIGTQAIDGSRYMQDIVALGNEIEKRTRGEVAIDWVSDGRLGDEVAMANMIASGKLDGGGLSQIGLAVLVPEMAAWGKPGRFDSYEEVDRAMAETDVRARFAKHDLVFAMWADLGFARVFSTEPIASLAGVVSMPTAAMIDRGTKLWALPPLYMLAIGADKARYMSNEHYQYVVGGLVLSSAAWAKLDAKQQQVVRDVCAASEPRIRTRWRKETARGAATLEKLIVAR